jgi:hypothetical protein
MSTRAVQVVFASQRSTADRVMMERIRKMPDTREWVVVSSDNDVITTAKLRRMQTMSAVDFAVLMKSPSKPVVDLGEEADVRLSKDEVEEWLKLFGNRDRK